MVDFTSACIATTWKTPRKYTYVFCQAYDRSYMFYISCLLDYYTSYIHYNYVC